VAGGISSTANTMPSPELSSVLTVAIPACVLWSNPVPSVVKNVASTTTVYLVGKPTFAVGSLAMYGQISCRRMR